MGTFGAAEGLEGSSNCTTCPAGSYCDHYDRTAPKQCPAGTYRKYVGATRRADCILCMPGTYSTEAGLTEPCGLCPAGSYCPTSTTIDACPAHTNSAAGSFSGITCICDNGFTCDYEKRVEIVMALSCSAADFEADTDGVRTTLIASLAAAGGVAPTSVTINEVVSAPGAGVRRLLGAATTVRATVMGAVSMRTLKSHASSVVEYSWKTKYSSQSRRNLPL